MSCQIWCVQERPEDVPTGELPRNILMTVDRSMVGTIAPGTRITAVAIYSTVQVLSDLIYSPNAYSKPSCGTLAWQAQRLQGSKVMLEACILQSLQSCSRWFCAGPGTALAAWYAEFGPNKSERSQMSCNPG